MTVIVMAIFDFDFKVYQNYNKILECDWLSPAQYEH